MITILPFDDILCRHLMLLQDILPISDCRNTFPVIRFYINYESNLFFYTETGYYMNQINFYEIAN